MDLYSGLPYWVAKNSLYNYFNPLERDHSTDVLIIGSGITGALVAHELCRSGIKCTVIDKRTPSTGSSSASTALLQYEIDVPLYKMAGMIGGEKALLAYQCCLQAISDVRDVFESIGVNPDYERVPSLFYASNKKGAGIIEKEYEIRRKNGLPTTLLSAKDIKEMYGFDAPAGLLNDASAQIDAYLAATVLLDFHMTKSGLTLFTHSQIVEWNKKKSEYELLSDNGHKIKCKYVVVAAGFEAGTFLPEKVMQLTSTYALVSEPVFPELIWQGRSLLWETKEPYIYIRTTKDNRIIVGGEDEEFRDPVKRDKLLRKKTEKLEKKIQALFPHIPFKTSMAWCGTFSSTKDGLPYIGEWPGREGMFFALGYGGNGITFSMNAAQMIRNRILEKADKRYQVFGFERYQK
ncbi:FAD-binding oxidoreductase [Bacteroides sp. 51]|uniref:NAD(P)/FAD-dependent oxidoreductase n=1 Tax=Bacteroides sp. 51 TaxID=2302938 RepID=UPI0013D423CE|nr:FAD-dependent oxidoreductase [Bacteroides sp. 51]NDV84558.1 FAD-binding oxidoreductase [Bacteroides sp. 51]